MFFWKKGPNTQIYASLKSRTQKHQAQNETGLNEVRLQNVSALPAENLDQNESYPTGPVNSADWQLQHATGQWLGQDRSAIAEHM